MKYIAFISCFLFTMALQAEVFYASPEGTGDCSSYENPGSISDAWQKALDAGDSEVILLEGKYDLTNVNSGQSQPQIKDSALNVCQKKISLTGEEGKSVVLYSTSENKRAIGLKGGVGTSIVCKNIEFSGFTLKTATYGGSVVLNWDSTAEFSNCIFTANNVDITGGLVYGMSSAVNKFHQCRFVDNVKNYNSALIYSYNVFIEDSVFGSVKTSVDSTNGFIIHLLGGEFSVKKTVFENIDIRATGWSWLIHLPNGVVADFEDCVFKNITSSSPGPIVVPYARTAGSGVLFKKCVFDSVTNNNSTGGIFNNAYEGCYFAYDRCIFSNCSKITQGTGFTFKNSLFCDNFSYENAAGKIISLFQGKGAFMNSTFVANKGKGDSVFANDTTLANCVFYGNKDMTDINFRVKSCNNTYYETYLNTQPSEEVDQNHQFRDGENPGFAGEGDFPYSLKSSSILRKKGKVADWMTGAFDLAGNPRLSVNGEVDIGAYQYLAKSGFSILLR